jgi:hypothetical protein
MLFFELILFLITLHPAFVYGLLYILFKAYTIA